MAYMFRYSWRFAKGQFILSLFYILIDAGQPLFSVIMPKHILDELTGERRRYLQRYVRKTGGILHLS